MEVMLKQRNFNLANRCAMCLEEEESVDHMFIHSSLWFLALSLIVFSLAQLSNVKDVLVS